MLCSWRAASLSTRFLKTPSNPCQHFHLNLNPRPRRVHSPRKLCPARTSTSWVTSTQDGVSCAHKIHTWFGFVLFYFLPQVAVGELSSGAVSAAFILCI